MFINWQLRQLNLKLVYYGPAMSGKTTNLEQIHRRVDPDHRSSLVAIKTSEDRTLYFDFFQVELGKIAGMTPNIQLYTVPGQSYYESSRKLVLKGADGIVFVADSTPDRLEENVQAWHDMNCHLKELDIPIEAISIVVQYNKRDIKNATSITKMKRALGSRKYQGFSATAIEGIGIFDTFKASVNNVFAQIQKMMH